MSPSYRCGWVLFRSIYALYFRARYLNPERVPETGSVILVSNHASYLDPPLVGTGLPRNVNYLARESLFRFPVMGRVLRSWDAVPVDRDGGSASGLRLILERLSRGGAILLFPEGTRTRDGAMQAPRAGIGLIVAKSTAPVIPVRVFGTLEAFGRHRRVPRPHQICVKYGKPLGFADLRAEGERCSKTRLKEIYSEIARDLMTEIGKLGAYRDVEAFANRIDNRQEE